MDFKNSSFDAQKLVDSAQQDPLAGDIYSGVDNQNNGGNITTYNELSLVAATATSTGV